MELIDSIQALVKALEGGSYNAAPGALTQGSALQVEDLSTVMENVTFDDSHLKLQKMVKSESCKSTLAQFNRQLSYGIFGGSAQIEGHVGQEETSDFVRVVVPMCFYSHTRRVTLVANLVQTGDGVKAEERAAADAAKKIAGDIEFDLFRGMADFSNAGVFDGNPSTSVMPALPNMQGIDLQIRQSDNQRNARDLMFAEYGSDDTVVISAGGVMTQDHVEDASVRSALNFGNAEKLIVDPRVLSAYNKIIFAKERVILAGSPQTSTGGDLQKQWVSGGTVSVEASRFLSGKAKPAPYRPKSGLTNTGMSVSPVTTTDTAAVTAFKAGQIYQFKATPCNELGEGPACALASMTISADGDKGVVTIVPPSSGTVRYFNVYRTLANGAAGSEKFIGRVAANGASNVTFTDLGNKLPGFVTGFLLEADTMGMKELAPYSRLKLAVTDLSQPEAHFRFCTLAVYQPRKNVLIDNLRGY
jgi:hypothetical protein